MLIKLSLLCTQLTRHTLQKYPLSRMATIEDTYFQNTIIADALMSEDLIYEAKKSDREYRMNVNDAAYLAEAQKEEYDYLRNLIRMVSLNNGTKIYPNDHGFCEQKKDELLLKSIKNFESRFAPIKSSEDYRSLRYSRKNSMMLYEKHDEMLHYFKEKIKDKKKRTSFIGLLEELKLDFIIPDENEVYFYPVISDLFYDTFHMDYYAGQFVDLTSAMRQSISATKRYQKNESPRLPKLLYDKVLFLEEIKIPNLTNYIFLEYARTFQCDSVKFRELYLEILYFTTQKSTALQSDLDISDIYPREFLLCMSKIVLPLDKPLLSFETI